MVTARDTAGFSTPKRYATALFNHWRIGPQYKNNGVLVLVVPEQRRIEVEIGRGLDTAFQRHEWLTDMLNEKIVPMMKQGLL